MENNVYQTPESSLETPNNKELQLASRWSRLFASIIDSIILLVIMLPVMYLTGGFDVLTTGEEPGFIYNVIISIGSWVLFVLINGKFLVSNGQTIGKKAMEIRIIDLNGNVPDTNTLIKRYAVYFVPNIIPVAGGIFALVNVLFIFGEEKRCLHDQVGGTKVVNAK